MVLDRKHTSAVTVAPDWVAYGDLSGGVNPAFVKLRHEGQVGGQIGTIEVVTSGLACAT